MVFRHTFGTPRKEIMATIRKHYKKWQVIIRKRGIPRISKIFLKYSEAIRYAQELETQISKGEFPLKQNMNIDKLNKILK